MHIDRSELYRYLTRRYSYVDAEEVNDAVQSAIVATWEVSVLREPPRNAQAYSTVVAHRTLLRYIEYRRRHIRPVRDEETGWEALESLGAATSPASATESIVDAHAVLETIPTHYADVLRRHYLEGHTLEELAKADGITPECMRKRHERAIKCARKMFGEKPTEK